MKICTMWASLRLQLRRVARPLYHPQPPSLSQSDHRPPWASGMFQTPGSVLPHCSTVTALRPAPSHAQLRPSRSCSPDPSSDLSRSCLPQHRHQRAPSPARPSSPPSATSCRYRVTFFFHFSFLILSKTPLCVFCFQFLILRHFGPFEVKLHFMLFII